MIILSYSLSCFFGSFFYFKTNKHNKWNQGMDYNTQGIRIPETGLNKKKTQEEKEKEKIEFQEELNEIQEPFEEKREDELINEIEMKPTKENIQENLIEEEKRMDKQKKKEEKDHKREIKRKSNQDVPIQQTKKLAKPFNKKLEFDLKSEQSQTLDDLETLFISFSKIIEKESTEKTSKEIENNNDLIIKMQDIMMKLRENEKKPRKSKQYKINDFKDEKELSKSSQIEQRDKVDDYNQYQFEVDSSISVVKSQLGRFSESYDDNSSARRKSIKKQKIIEEIGESRGKSTKHKKKTKEDDYTQKKRNIEKKAEKLSFFPVGVGKEEKQQSAIMQATELSFINGVTKISSEKVDSEDSKKQMIDEDQIILDVIKIKENCNNYVNFTWDEFNQLWEWTRHVCCFYPNNSWVDKVYPRPEIDKPISENIPPKFSFFFYLYMLKKSPKLLNAYYEMKMERFSDSNTDSGKRTFCSDHFYKCATVFSKVLYSNFVESRQKIGYSNYPSLAEGRVEEFRHLIRDLDKCFLIVDGKNQNVSTKKYEEGGELHLDKRFYNHKSNGSGVKVLAKVDVFGYCCYVTNHQPAALHDCSLYNIEFDGKVTPKDYWEIGDGGFRGGARCLTPYPRKCCSSIFENSFISDKTEIVSFLEIDKGEEKYWTFEGGFYGVVTKNTFEGKFEGRAIEYSAKNFVKFKGKGEVTALSEYDGHKGVFYKLEKFNCSEGFIQTETETKDTTGEIQCDVIGSNTGKNFLKAYNCAISSIRILVENFFGRENCLWDIMSRKYKWLIRHYDDFKRSCVALTNVHIFFHPLRKFPFQLFSFTKHNTLGIKLESINRIKIPVSCMKTIGIERFSEVENDFISLGDGFHQKPVKKGILPNKSTVKIPSGKFDCEPAVFGERTRKEDVLISYQTFDNSIKRILDETFIEVDSNEILSEYTSYDTHKTQPHFTYSTNDRLSEIKTTKQLDIIEEEKKPKKRTSVAKRKTSSGILKLITKPDSKKIQKDPSEEKLDKEIIQQEKKTWKEEFEDEKTLFFSGYKEINHQTIVEKEKKWLDSSIYNIWRMMFFPDIPSRFQLIDEAWFSRIQLHEEGTQTKSKENLHMKIFKSNDSPIKIIPCCHQMTHFTLALWDTEINKLFIIDSFGNKNNHEILKKLLEMRTHEKKLETEYVEVEKQEDSWSCGYRMITWIKIILQSKDDSFIENIKKVSEEDLKQTYWDIEKVYQIKNELNKFMSKKFKPNSQCQKIQTVYNGTSIDLLFQHLYSNNFINMSNCSITIPDLESDENFSL